MRLFLLAALGVALALPAAAQTPGLPPLDPSSLAPATLRYTAALSIMGQALEMPFTRTITRQTTGAHHRWRVVDATTIPDNLGGGGVSDTSEVDAATMLPSTRRMVVQTPMGAQALRLDFTSGGVSGTTSGVGQQAPLAATFDGPVLGGGAALDLALAAMPLAEGFADTVRVYDPQQGAGARAFRLAVRARETATVPAGAFETFKVEIAPLDGDPAGTGTFWLTVSAPHHLVRGEALLPAAMGGGTMTVALTGRD